MNPTNKKVLFYKTMKQTIKEEMLTIISHLFWFYNADMADMENQKDFKQSIEKLELLVKSEQ